MFIDFEWLDLAFMLVFSVSIKPFSRTQFHNDDCDSFDAQLTLWGYKSAVWKYFYAFFTDMLLIVVLLFWLMRLIKLEASFKF